MVVIIKRPGERAEEATIPNTLEALQKAVGGYIETVTLATDLVIICNEEGLINDLPYNCTICGYQFFGDIIICGVDGEEFSDIPLTFQEYKRMFGRGLK